MGQNFIIYNHWVNDWIRFTWPHNSYYVLDWVFSLVFIWYGEIFPCNMNEHVSLSLKLWMNLLLAGLLLLHLHWHKFFCFDYSGDVMFGYKLLPSVDESWVSHDNECAIGDLGLIFQKILGIDSAGSRLVLIVRNADLMQQIAIGCKWNTALVI